VTLLPIGQTGSHAGPVFRDAFRAVTPRVTGFIGNTISDPLGVVDVGSAGSPQYWPEDPSSAGEPWTDANVVHMGAGDGLELVAGGADADNEIAAVIIYVLDPIIDNETGAVVAFVERRLVAFNVTLGAAQVGASDPLADLDVVSVGDHLADTIAARRRMGCSRSARRRGRTRSSRPASRSSSTSGCSTRRPPRSGCSGGGCRATR